MHDVNAVFSQLQWWPQSLMQCNCKLPASMTLMILTGVKSPVYCPHCRQGYQIEGFAMDPQRGPVAVIAVLPKLEEKRIVS